MSAMQATATGTLGATPVLNLLVYLLGRKLSGTVVVEDHRYRKNAVLFEAGVPTKAKTADPVICLGPLLVELGRVDEDLSNRTLTEASKAGLLHGQVLVAREVIDAATLAEALAEQVTRKVVALASLRPESVYGYYDGQSLLAAWGGPEGTPPDPLEVIWRVARVRDDRDVIERTLGRFGSREIRLHAQARVNRFGFGPRERGMLDVLRAKPQSLQDFLGAGLLPEEDVKRILYVLTITRHLDLGDEEAAPMGIDLTAHPVVPVVKRTEPRKRRGAAAAAPKVRAAPEGRTSAEGEALEKEVDALNAAIGGQNYYEILGVSEDAAPTGIQAAFFQLAKKWHPDRLDPSLSHLRSKVVHVFSRMTEAHQVLSSEERRREYANLMKGGGATADEQEKVQQILRAATAFQKAEILLKQGRMADAEKQAAQAATDDPEQAEYAALYADILSRNPDKKDFKDVIRMVNTARKLQEGNIRVRLYRGRVLKRAGEHAMAAKEFRYVAENDPRNVEAAREMRLYGMRGGKGVSMPAEKKPSPKTESTEKKDLLNQDVGELFGKFFKR